MKTATDNSTPPPTTPPSNPSRYTRARVAKAVNYIALGDSYSAGENGRDEAAGFVGAYQEDVRAADGKCKRWDRSYPVVFKDDLLGAAEWGIQVEFQTFACVGAITLNVFDSSDPDGNERSRVTRSIPTARPRTRSCCCERLTLEPGLSSRSVPPVMRTANRCLLPMFRAWRSLTW